MKKTALIVCNGEPPPPDLLKHFWGKVDLRLCADGGANFVSEQGLLPDMVIGDMDSISESTKNQIGEQRLFIVEEQETNDADKAIRFCLENQVDKVHLLGAAGIRNDQFLANIELLYKYGTVLKIVMWTQSERMEIIQEVWKEKLPIGTTISLVPLFGKVEKITTNGLAFPLINQPLELGKEPSGVSNRITKSPVQIKVGSGKLLVIAQISI